MPLVPGKNLGRYEIIEQAGSGGMGEVYKARDSRLDRTVAIKILPSTIAGMPDLKVRFEREARAISRLKHPNICTLYDIDHQDGADFLVMEYLEGETLAVRLSKGPLPYEELLDIAVQISSALDSAHRQGMIHRDLKPGNIMLTKEGAKLMDFGLVKVKTEKDDQRISDITRTPALTRVGSIVGTTQYMSPEQIRGSHVDHRSDIFSFGVVLYEMITGQLPFKGEYEASMVYSIINDTPEPAGRFRKDLPAGMEDLISRTLEKDAGSRYQDISELISDLKRISASGVEIEPSPNKRNRKLATGIFGAILVAAAAAIALILICSGSEKPATIAVLPFEDMGERADTVFAGAIAGGITSQLTKVGGLNVIARSSCMQYEKSGMNAVDFARSLQADYVIEGTVLWDKVDTTIWVKITPNLIRVSDGTQVWSDSYEEVLDEIFRVVTEISVKVIHQVGSVLQEKERVYVQRPPTENEAAYLKYLRGGYYFGRSWDRQDIELAIEMYQEAVDLDPDFALAFAWLSDAHSTMYREFYDRTENRVALARSAADRALRLEPDLPDAHLALGMYYYSLMMPDSALLELTVARRSQPNNSEIYAAIAGVQRRRGDIDSAIKNYLKAFGLDPRSYLKAFDVSYTYGLMRKYSLAAEYLDQAIGIAPDWPLPYVYKAWLCLFAEGSREKAAAVLRQASTKVDLSQTEYREYYWWLSRILDDDPAVTLKRITPGVDSVGYYLHRARLYRFMQKLDLMKAYSDSARAILESLVISQPAEPRFHSQLGLAYIGSGRANEAIDEGRKAVALLRESEEATYAQFWVANLAEIYMLAGDYNSAVETLRMLLNIPGFASPKYLMIDPLWNPLHDYPGFQQLIRSQGEDESG